MPLVLRFLEEVTYMLNKLTYRLLSGAYTPVNKIRVFISNYTDINNFAYDKNV